MSEFLDLGFLNIITESSNNPSIDGYVATNKFDLPYHIHPIATKQTWDLLQKAILENEITIVKYSAPIPNSQQLLAEYKQAAKNELDKSDITILRAIESGLTINNDWKNYREELRNIIKTAIVAGALPVKPAYQS